jgi:hypothetical protein
MGKGDVDQATGAPVPPIEEAEDHRHQGRGVGDEALVVVALGQPALVVDGSQDPLPSLVPGPLPVTPPGPRPPAPGDPDGSVEGQPAPDVG